ncbi:SDR family NAD(P)-dependent oxidoreductase [Candidatus Latescibacterota bacterium]
MGDELFSVEGQVVVVSGGSRGIGRALAEGFAERQAQVIITGRQADTLARTAEEISTGEHPVAFRVCDVSRPEEIDGLVDSVAGEFDHLDGLLNVAGVNKRRRVEEFDLDEYDWIMDTNLRGAFALAQKVGRHMIGRGSGSIINIDSFNTYAPLVGVAPYAISKAGLQMMTRSLASEWGKHDVRVNGIAPGFFPTDLAKELWAQEEMASWVQKQTPLGRLGKVKELIGAAIFLASPAATFVTGHTLRVDGGMSAGINWPIQL